MQIKKPKVELAVNGEIDITSAACAVSSGDIF